jgi:hypothetical protein
MTSVPADPVEALRAAIAKVISERPFPNGVQVTATTRVGDSDYTARGQVTSLVPEEHWAMLSEEYGIPGPFYFVDIDGDRIAFGESQLAVHDPYADDHRENPE